MYLIRSKTLIGISGENISEDVTFKTIPKLNILHTE